MHNFYISTELGNAEKLVRFEINYASNLSHKYSCTLGLLTYCLSTTGPINRQVRYK